MTEIEIQDAFINAMVDAPLERLSIVRAEGRKTMRRELRALGISAVGINNRIADAMEVADWQRDCRDAAAERAAANPLTGDLATDTILHAWIGKIGSGPGGKGRRR